VNDQPDTEPARWRSLAVSRSVDPAREAAEERVQRFLDAAVDLLNSPRGTDFTVQNVVDGSGLSIRSFYHHFAGKHELLLALFEESVRTTADYLQREMEAFDEPLDRLKCFTTEYYRLCRTGQPSDTNRLPSRAMGKFAHQLLFDHPQEAAHAFTPLVSMLRKVLDDAAASGAIAPQADNQEVAGIIVQAVMFNSFATTVVGSTTDDVPDRAALVWELLIHGLSGARQRNS
jgi:AcrR family transcriptional regulator